MSQLRLLPRTWVGLGMMILLMPLLLVSARQMPQASWHQTYSYFSVQGPSNVGVPPGQHYYLVPPGTELHLPWQPFATGASWESSPSWFLRQDELVGPFPSLARLQEVIQHALAFGGRTVEGPVLATGQLLLADSWTNTSYTSSLLVSPHQAPGYYALVETIHTLGESGSALGVAPLYIPL